MAQNEGFDRARLRRIDDWMQRYVDDGKFPGCSVLIARNGTIAHRYETGMRSIGKQLPYEADTIVRIFSMSKLITSTAVMLLLEKGLIHLDAPISRFLPEFSDCRALIAGATSLDQTEPCAAPTIHHLLTHTAGMTYGLNSSLLSDAYDRAGLNFFPDNKTLAEKVRDLASLPLMFVPGSRFEYSASIDVAGRVIEAVSGKTLDRFLRDEIFSPLGMDETWFALPEDKIDRFADCYELTDTDPMRLYDSAEDSRYLEGRVATLSGGGGLLSTLDDYFRFGEMIRRGGALDGNRLLSPRTVSFMRQNHLPDGVASVNPTSFAEMPMDVVGFGIGGAVVTNPAKMGVPGSVGDFGWGGLASTFFWTDPVEQLTVVFFTQLIPSDAYPNRAELKALVHGALVA